MSGSGEGPQPWDPDRLLALALSQPSEALVAAREVLAGRPSPAQAAVAHQTIGVVLRDFGDIAAALTQLKTAHRLARRAADPQRSAEILASLGVAWVLAGHTRRGLAALEEAAQASTGDVAGRILIRRANALWVLGRNPEALRDARAAVALLAGTGDLVWQARALHHHATACFALGMVERADQDYARAEDLFTASGQRLEAASARHDRGVVAFARGDLPGALAHLDDAQRVFEQLGVFEPELVVNKCTVLLAGGLSRDALHEVDSAITRIEGQLGSATRRAELLYCAALAAHAAGDLDIAGRRSADALRLFRRQQRGWWAARAELVLLQCQRVSGDERSATLLRRARRVTAELDALDAERAVEAHLLTGQLALARGRGAEAEHHLRIAARARRHGLRTRSAGWLARATLCHGQGRWRAMLTACDRGLETLDLHLRTLGATELRALATTQGAELAGMALRRAVSRQDARGVLQWSERWRAAALAVPPVSRPRDAELATELAALRALSQRLEVNNHRDSRAPLNRERRRLEDAVRRRVLRTPGAVSRASAPLRPADLLSELGDTSLIELADLDGELYAVVAGQGRTRLRHVGPTANAQRSLASALFALRRESVRRGDVRLDLDQVGARLESDLLGPSVQRLGQGPVVVVPTPRLHAVPWGLMPSLRRRPTTVAPSASAWLRARRAVPPADGATVLVGGPNLSTGAQEVSMLAERYPDAIVLAEGNATADRVLAAMDGAWLVHIASHGTFRADSPLFSALELDDGPLTVYDLEGLARPPHRVVLSSCSSAVGVPAGADELLGLVSALIGLGSAGVVASVVPVEDPATVPLMLALHEHLHGGSSLAAALASARQAVDDDARARTAADSFIALGV